MDRKTIHSLTMTEIDKIMWPDTGGENSGK